MTTAATTQARAVTEIPTDRTRSTVPLVLHYLGATLRHSISDPGFIGFLLAMPTAMYLFFAQLYGDVPEYGAQIKQDIMVMMASYGAMGSALAAGNTIQQERSTGWFRQLMLSALTPTAFFGVRVAAALLLIIPPIALVLGVGAIDGVRLDSWTTWLEIIGVSLITLIPFVVMGIVVGLWMKPQAASAATTFLMLGMAMLGGMWVPLDQMPNILQEIGKVLPSYWSAQYALLPVTGDPIEMRGVIILLVWTVSLALLGVLGYRRAVGNSKR